MVGKCSEQESKSNLCSLSGKTTWSVCGTKPREREEDAVFFEQVFHTDVAPILSQIDANGKKGHKCVWCY